MSRIAFIMILLALFVVPSFGQDVDVNENGQEPGVTKDDQDPVVTKDDQDPVVTKDGQEPDVTEDGQDPDVNKNDKGLDLTKNDQAWRQVELRRVTDDELLIKCILESVQAQRKMAGEVPDSKHKREWLRLEALAQRILLGSYPRSPEAVEDIYKGVTKEIYLRGGLQSFQVAWPSDQELSQPYIPPLKNRATVKYDHLIVTDWTGADFYRVVFTQRGGQNTTRLWRWIQNGTSLLVPDDAEKAQVYPLRVKLDKQSRFIVTREGRPIVEAIGTQMIENIESPDKLGIQLSYLPGVQGPLLHLPTKGSPVKNLPKLGISSILGGMLRVKLHADDERFLHWYVEFFDEKKQLIEHTFGGNYGLDGYVAVPKGAVRHKVIYYEITNPLSALGFKIIGRDHKWHKKRSASKKKKAKKATENAGK